MEATYQDGAICLSGKWYEPATYHVSNAQLSAVFDGKGSVVSYALANAKAFINRGYLFLRANDEPVDVCVEKQVCMCGRRQTVTIATPVGALVVELFLDHAVNGVFFRYTFTPDREEDVLSVGIASNAVPEKEAIFRAPGDLLADSQFAIAASRSFVWAGPNRSIYFSCTASHPTMQLFLSCGGSAEEARAVCDRFDDYRAACLAEIAAVQVPEGLDARQTALYDSCYFCALENYKEKDGYRGFMAGCNYLLPMRTYYRDSYYTVLPMYSGNLEKVRAQILTLARGIKADGTCPSAVTYGYGEWWGNHFDSPSFLTMMLYDYVHFTKDLSILHETYEGRTVLADAQRALENLATFTDETGLLYKPGKYNKRDWADEVNRSGYVTYDEVLFARALQCMAKLFAWISDEAQSAAYAARYTRVKDAINELLWDESRGYYVNFKTADETEANLSVDTVFAAIFEIAPPKRAKRMLSAMEQILETRHNSHQMAGDYGVMSVYPFYRQIDGAYWKSTQPYYYHNGANWPYLSAMYAYAKRKYGMEYRYALESWFEYNVRRGNYTPIEFFSSVQPDGSMLQAWSGVVAFVMNEALSLHFFD